MYGTNRVAPQATEPIERKRSVLTGSSFIHGRVASLSLGDRLQVTCSRIAILTPCLFAGLVGLSIGIYQLIMSENLMKRSIVYTVTGGGVVLVVTYLALVICCRVRIQDLTPDQQALLAGNTQESQS
jgi:hypothetical protein